MSSQFPFGFNPQDFGDDFSFNPQFAGELFSHLGNMMSHLGSAINSGGAMSPEHTRDEVIRLALEKYGKDTPVTVEETIASRSALSLANVWLNDSTIFPETSSSILVWSPHEWIKATADSWIKLCTPLLNKSATMWSSQLDSSQNELSKMLSSFSDSINSLNLVNQLGPAIADLATHACTSTDNGLALYSQSSEPSIVVHNIKNLADTVEIPKQEFLIFMVLREAAHQRLHYSARWLNPFFYHLLELFAQEVTIDFDDINSHLTSIDISSEFDIQQIQEIIAEKLTNTQNNEEQAKITVQLQNMLALIEGWVHAVSIEAIGDRLPHLSAMLEVTQRNISSTSGGGQSLARLLGIELLPRRVRDTASFYFYLSEHAGQEIRDKMWSHPDLLPSSEEIDSPQQYLSRITASPNDKEFDIELEKLLNSPEENEES